MGNDDQILHWFTDTPKLFRSLEKPRDAVRISPFYEKSLCSVSGNIEYYRDGLASYSVSLSDIDIVRLPGPVHTVYGQDERSIIVLDRDPHPKEDRATAVFDSNTTSHCYNCRTREFKFGFLHKLREVGWHVPDIVTANKSSLNAIFQWLDEGKTIYAFQAHKSLPPFSPFPLGSLDTVFTEYLVKKGAMKAYLTCLSIQECVDDHEFWLEVCKHPGCVALFNLLSLKTGVPLQEFLAEILTRDRLQK